MMVTSRSPGAARWQLSDPLLAGLGTNRLSLRFPLVKMTEVEMLYYALVFLEVAFIAGVLGFGGIAGASASIAQVLFFIFLVLFVVSIAMRVIKR